jgi:ribosomal protein S21
MEVVVRDSFEEALRVFKKGCAPIIREVRDRHQGYFKPSERRKRKDAMAQVRRKKAEKKKEMQRGKR